MNKYILLLLLFLITSLSVYGQDDFFIPSSTLGGYGELHYNKTLTEEKTTNVLDFHRFVMFYGYQWTENWSFKSEIELEHNFVSEGEGALELEQALVDYHYDDWLGLQAGVLLPAVGLLNEYHEPPLFFGVERPEYNKLIIPTTWFGSGVALYGNYADFDYKLTVMEGLNADKISAKYAIRSARQKGFKANADDLLYSVKVDYLGINGLKIGGSFTYNNSTGDSINIPVSLFEAHLKYTTKNLHVISEFGNITFGEGNLKASMGYYIDFGYNIGDVLSVPTQIIPFVRYSKINTASQTIFGGDSEKEFDKSKWMIGLNVLPISEVVLKLDYSKVKVKLNNKKTSNFNLGIGYMF